MSEKVILLVEDNSSDVALTQRAFAKSRLTNEIVVVGDGQSALDYLFCEGEYAGRPSNDLPTVVLLDLRMPRMDGHAFLRRLRADERTRRLPVVVMTTSNEEQDVAQSYDLGANSYIRKPVDFAQFIEAVKMLGLYWLVLNEPPPTRVK